MSPLQSGVPHSFQFTFIMHNLPIPHPACMGWERIRKGERERETYRAVQVTGYYFSRRIVAWTSFGFLCFIFMTGEEERLAVPERINFRGLWLRWNREQRRVSRPIASSRDFLGASTIVSRCSKGARRNNLDDDNLSAM